MKILNTDDLMEVADKILDSVVASDTFSGTPKAVADAQQAVIDAVDALAEAIAKHFDIEKGDTTWEGKDLAGLCASFSQAHPDQECPAPIHEGDEGGEWDWKVVLP